MIRKCLAIGIILLFIGITVQPSFASEVSSIRESNENDDNSRDSELVNILCYAYYIFWVARSTRPAFFVKFELIDYDTGKVIEQTTKLFGIHLFKYVPKGHDYVIKVTTSRGWEDFKIQNLDSFYWLPIGIIVENRGK
jgi:hypothetical protein